MYNWQNPEWPEFQYDASEFVKHEREFLKKAGQIDGKFMYFTKQQSELTLVDLLVSEAIKSSAIEGEMISRTDLSSSIKRHLGFDTPQFFIKDKRSAGFAKLLVSSRESFESPLSESMLFEWHTLLMQGQYIKNVGAWRSHTEPMQVISGSIGKEKVHFEAPPSSQVQKEMNRFFDWFSQANLQSILIKAAIAHLYFESIHPFEDGNGRIGRLISEKALSMGLGKPVMFSISTIIEKKRNEYYEALKNAQKSIQIGDWVLWFCEMVLEAQDAFDDIVSFSIKKAKFFEKNNANFNERQNKAIAKMLEKGEFFEGGMSAKKYVSITRCSLATATRDLVELAEKGILTINGNGRSRNYQIFFD
jgi:Fic family protein